MRTRNLTALVTQAHTERKLMRLAGDDGQHVLMAPALSDRIARNPLLGRWEVSSHGLPTWERLARRLDL